MAGHYKAPDVPKGKVTPTLVRDELLKCFEDANKEFMHVLNMPTEDAVLKAQVRQFVTGSFQSCGASFDQPTKEGIVSAISQCKANAEAMMGQKGSTIIKEHYDEMMKLVNKLPASR
ncbi:MAG TPA: hypothetical protein VLU99_02855 [Nitrososphaerales archaeon]|nr:hypothetical protein [Nitrososphaerales archaeon]HUK74706.1 hypothetical protein [Nitrososphaerales archaeon]